MGGGALGLPPEPWLWLGSLLGTCGVFSACSVPSTRGLRFAEHAVPAADIEAGVGRGLVLQPARLWVVSVGALPLFGICNTLRAQCPAVGPAHSKARSEGLLGIHSARAALELWSTHTVPEPGLMYAASPEPTPRLVFAVARGTWYPQPYGCFQRARRSAPAAHLLSGVYLSNWCLQRVCAHGVRSA